MVVAVPAWRALVDLLALTQSGSELATRVERSLFVVALGWLVVEGMAAAALWFRASLGAEIDTPAARSLRTQIALLRRVASVIVALIVASVVLLQFDLVRDFGMSLLASAGVAGVVLGLAAQKTLSAIIAGIQLSFAQQIRIGDTIVLDKELGKVEEIHLTHAVVKVWDERRLVVPIQRFLEQTFENWTKIEDQLRGTVFLDADWRVPVDVLRQALERYCKESPLWDGRVCKLIVSDAQGEAVTLRALVSARNSDDVWDLRCALREHLVAVLRDLEGGKYLRRQREEHLAA
jgi:small-conductance mechanosensitive channel